MAINWIALAMFMFPAASKAAGKAQHLRLVEPEKSGPPPIAPPIPASLPPKDQEPETKTIMVQPRGKSVSREVAIREFLELMSDAGGGQLQFKHVARNYAELGHPLGWPEMSGKALSTEICARGCTRHVGKRMRDGTRPTIITFPQSIKRRAA